MAETAQATPRTRGTTSSTVLHGQGYDQWFPDGQKRSEGYRKLTCNPGKAISGQE